MTNALFDRVYNAVQQTPVTDLHTHLFAPHFGPAMVWGIDQLLTYHYIQAETARHLSTPLDAYLDLPLQQQAEVAFDTLFIKNTPLSESCRGVLTALQALGVDTGVCDLDAWRKAYQGQTPQTMVDRVFAVANIRDVVMTNDPLDDAERAVWDAAPPADARFHAALRLDPLVLHYPAQVQKLQGYGYTVSPQLDEASIAQIKRFLLDECRRMNPLYMAISLPGSFRWPDDSQPAYLLNRCVLPVCAQLGLPLALMVGVRRGVNPQLRMAGDASEPCDLQSIEWLCRMHPRQKFLVTLLSREDQHALCVAARKFRNLLPFGCWWFLNNPSLIEEITRMRLEMLGTTFVAQHSDCRVLDQLAYKWAHSRRVLAVVLADQYAALAQTGWQVTDQQIAQDAQLLLGGAFWRFINTPL